MSGDGSGRFEFVRRPRAAVAARGEHDTGGARGTVGAKPPQYPESGERSRKQASPGLGAAARGRAGADRAGPRRVRARCSARHSDTDNRGGIASRRAGGDDGHGCGQPPPARGTGGTRRLATGRPAWSGDGGGPGGSTRPVAGRAGRARAERGFGSRLTPDQRCAGPGKNPTGVMGWPSHRCPRRCCSTTGSRCHRGSSRCSARCRGSGCRVRGCWPSRLPSGRRPG